MRNSNNGIFESEILKFWIEDNILFGYYKIRNIDLNVAKQATEQRLNFTDRKDYVTIVDFSNVKSTSKEARDYYATDEPSSHIVAMAILIDSQLGKIMGNFYLKISKPKFPLSLFTNKEEAVKWVRGYMKNK